MATDQDTTADRPKKAWTRRLSARIEIPRIDGESARDYRRRYERERYRLLKEADLEGSLRYWADKAARFRRSNPEKVAASKKAAVAKRPEKYKALHQAYYKANKADKIRAASAWRMANKDRANAASRRSYAKRKDQHRAIVKAWLARNPEYRREREHRRRALELGAAGSFTRHDTLELRRLQRDRCAFCRVRLNGKGDLDHILALSRGGSNDRKNLQWLCRPCNASKSAKDQLVFARERGMLL